MQGRGALAFLQGRDGSCGACCRRPGLLQLTAGCELRRTEPEWPDGALLIARTRALAGLLHQLRSLGDTPLARRAAEIEAQLPGCDLVEGQTPDGTLLDAAGGLRCAVPDGSLAARFTGNAAHAISPLPGPPGRVGACPRSCGDR